MEEERKPRSSFFQLAGEHMEKRPILSISLLASNRPDTIRRCLDSVKQIMNRISCELILVNTSGSEQIGKILTEYTNQIVEFEWCDDFAKARNAGLALAKGEWFLTLDDDEWFVDTDPIIEFFQNGEYKKYGCANYLVRNFYDPKYQHYSDAWVSRMIRLDEDTHYESKIHEYLYPVKGECKNIEALAYHSGYIFIDQEKRLEHFQRNEKLLKKMIEEEPERLRWRVQLLQEYRSVHRYNEMYTESMNCLKKFEHVNDSTDNRDIGTFYVAAMEGKLFLEEYEEAYRIGRLGIEDQRTSELCHAYIMLGYSVIFYHQKKWQEAEHAVNTYFQIFDYLQQNPIRFEIQKGALLVAEAFDDMALKKAYSILIASGLRQGKIAPLKKYFEKLGWNQDSVYLFDGIINDIVDGMALLEEDRIFLEVVEQAWSHPNLQKKMFIEIASYEEKNLEGYNQLLHYLAQTKINHWYIWYAKLLDADESVDNSSFEKYLREFINTMSNVFLLPNHVMELAKQRGISLEEIYMAVPLSKWEEHWREYEAKAESKDVYGTAQNILNLRTKEDIKFDLLSVMIAEYATFLYLSEAHEYSEMREKIEVFVNEAMAFLYKHFSEESLYSHFEQLPKVGQIACTFARALEAEVEHPKEAVNVLAEIPQIEANYAEPIKNFLLTFNNHFQNKEMYMKKEMETLKAQVMAEAEKCIINKDYLTALQIFEQLITILQEDLDVAEIMLQTRLLYLKSKA